MAGGLLSAPLAAEAQSIPRIGFLELTPAPQPVTPWRQALLQGLADLTFVSETEAAAHTLGLQLHVLQVRAEPEDIARAFVSLI